MLDFPIVDAHLHLWDPALLRYPWLDGDPLLNQAYLLPQYAAATAANPPEKMVFVQCEADFAQFMQEAEWVSAITDHDNRIAGIVAWAALEQGDAARPALERLAANPRIKGIRRIIQFEPDPAFCLRPGFVTGVQALADYGLSFDICIDHTQMENTIALVRQCPNVPFMLDHIAKPDIKNHLLEPWRSHLKMLAGFENVSCKMSGLVVEADWQRWTQADLKPYIDYVLDCFGFERIVFGGDWPVVLRAAQWQQWLETLLLSLDGASQAELRQLFHDNAIAFYRLT
ncbi:MAG: amidohydrolase family protein [Chloroflexi bacterium]|nr:amidohydrolase family protein [Chloroflexota bacterium]